MRTLQTRNTRLGAATFVCALCLTVSEARASCPLSIPKASLLGQESPSSVRWYGSDSLAAALPHDGIRRGLGAEQRFADKLFWLAAGFKPGMESDFSVMGRLLDENVTSLTPIVSAVTNARHDDFGGWTVLTGLGFPAPGCWEVTGAFQGQQLTFVVQVIDSDQQ